MKARARNACPTLTEAEFDALWSIAILERDTGGNRQAILAEIPTACFGSPVFDRDSECRACGTAVVEGVY